MLQQGLFYLHFAADDHPGGIGKGLGNGCCRDGWLVIYCVANGLQLGDNAGVHVVYDEDFWAFAHDPAKVELFHCYPHRSGNLFGLEKPVSAELLVILGVKLHQLTQDFL